MHGRGNAARPKRRRSSVQIDDSTSAARTPYAGSAFTDAELLAFESPAESSYRQNRLRIIPQADAAREASQSRQALPPPVFRSRSLAQLPAGSSQFSPQPSSYQYPTSGPSDSQQQFRIPTSFTLPRQPTSYASSTSSSSPYGSRPASRASSPGTSYFHQSEPFNAVLPPLSSLNLDDPFDYNDLSVDLPPLRQAVSSGNLPRRRASFSQESLALPQDRFSTGFPSLHQDLLPIGSSLDESIFPFEDLPPLSGSTRSISRKPSLGRFPSIDSFEQPADLSMRPALRRRASSRNFDQETDFSMSRLDSGSTLSPERSDPYDQSAFPQLPPLRRRSSDASMRTSVRHPAMSLSLGADQAGALLQNRTLMDPPSTSSTIGLASNACIECGRSFTRKGDLDRHMRSHAAELAHWCSRCQKGFVRRDAKM